MRKNNNVLQECWRVLLVSLGKSALTGQRGSHEVRMPVQTVAFHKFKARGTGVPRAEETRPMEFVRLVPVACVVCQKNPLHDTFARKTTIHQISPRF